MCQMATRMSKHTWQPGSPDVAGDMQPSELGTRSADGLKTYFILLMASIAPVFRAFVVAQHPAKCFPGTILFNPHCSHFTDEENRGSERWEGAGRASQEGRCPQPAGGPSGQSWLQQIRSEPWLKTPPVFSMTELFSSPKLEELDNLKAPKSNPIKTIF